MALYKVTKKQSGGGGSVNLYTNSRYYASDTQITNISGYTKLYDDTATVDYGQRGTKVDAALALTDESVITGYMNNGWQDSHSAYYDSESKLNAYAGYNFGSAQFITKVKIWLGRYSAQNNNLIATVQWLDSNGNWNDIEDIIVSTSLSYPLNIFEVSVNREVYGIRWIHKKEPYKTGGNNMSFFGMTLYEGTGSYTEIYVPDSTGLITIPSGYDGFGPLYI